MFETEHHTQHVGVESGRVAFCRLLRERPGLALGGGIVDGNVEAAEAGDGLVDQGAHLVFVTHVSADELGLGTQRAQFGDQDLALIVVAPGDDEVRAITREGQGGGAADAGQGAGNQDDGIGHGTVP